MKTETTNIIGLMTGEIKNNPSIYCGTDGFTIFLNGELILHGVPDFKQSTKENFIHAKSILEKLKFGEFDIEVYQRKFDSLIRK